MLISIILALVGQSSLLRGVIECGYAFTLFGLGRRQFICCELHFQGSERFLLCLFLLTNAHSVCVTELFPQGELKLRLSSRSAFLA